MDSCDPVQGAAGGSGGGIAAECLDETAGVARAYHNQLRSSEKHSQGSILRVGVGGGI